MTIDTRSIGITTPTSTRSRTTVAQPSRLGTSGVTAPTFQTRIPGTSIDIDLGDLARRGIGVVVDEGERRLRRALTGGQEPGEIGDEFTCPDGTISVFGQCADLTAALPGGDPFLTSPTDVAGVGVFGLMSVSPNLVGVIRDRSGQEKPILRCPVPGLVLGKDNRCYSKKDIPSSLRKWSPHKCRSATDRKLKAIKAAGAAAKSLQKSFKGSGYKVSKT